MGETGSKISQREQRKEIFSYIERLPYDLQYQLLLRLDTRNILEVCERIPTLSNLTVSKKFWLQKLEPLGVTEEEFDRGIPKPPFERYVELVSYYTDTYLPGMEKYISPILCLLRAAQQDNKRAVKLFSRTKENRMYQRDIDRLLFKIFSKGNWKIIKELPKWCLKNSVCFRALAENNHQTLLRHYLPRDIDSNLDLYLTVITGALSRGHYELAQTYTRELLRRKNREIQDRVLMEIAHVAAQIGDLELFRNFHSQEVTPSILTAAGRSGNPHLIKYVRDIAGEEIDWDKALFLGLVQGGHLNLALEILEKGYIPSQNDVKRIFNFALLEGRPDIARFLFSKHFPKLPVQSSRRVSYDALLFNAAIYDDPEMVEIAISLGARNFGSALLKAVESSSYKAARYIYLQYGSKIRDSLPQNLSLDWERHSAFLRQLLTDTDFIAMRNLFEYHSHAAPPLPLSVFL